MHAIAGVCNESDSILRVAVRFVDSWLALEELLLLE